VKAFTFNQRDIDILKAFLIFPYLTAEQVCSLFYSPNSLKYVMARLLWLTEERYLNRIEQPLQPYWYSLALRGTRTIGDRPVFYPPQKVHIMHHRHFLMTNEVLISAIRLLKVRDDITLHKILHDFSLKHMLKGVVPDGYVALSTDGERVPIAFEVHIDTKEQKFREKIRGIMQTVSGEFREKFPVVDPKDNKLFLTWSFLTPIERQVDEMVAWTESELTKLGKVKEADLFRFAYVPEKDIDPLELFTKEIHCVPFTKMYTFLI